MGIILYLVVIVSCLYFPSQGLGASSSGCHNSCSGHGHCDRISSYPYYKCTCNSGYTGDHCQHSSCSTSPCLNGGKCMVRSTGRFYECVCYNGYYGHNCHITHCTSHPCQNGGKCTHTTFGYHCDCSDGYTGANCDSHSSQSTATIPTTTSTSTTPSTTTATTTTSTSTASTTTTTVTTTIATTKSPVNYETCSKYAIIFNIAENVIEANNGSSRCVSGKSTAPEALVMNVCDLTTPSTWKPGVNVMSNCNSIPHYSPVATFSNGQYNPDSCVTGIFISCLTDEDGILMAIQRCDQVPLIEHIVTSLNSTLPDPHSFYTIQLSS